MSKKWKLQFFHTKYRSSHVQRSESRQSWCCCRPWRWWRWSVDLQTDYLLRDLMPCWRWSMPLSSHLGGGRVVQRRRRRRRRRGSPWDLSRLWRWSQTHRHQLLNLQRSLTHVYNYRWSPRQANHTSQGTHFALVSQQMVPKERSIRQVVAIVSNSSKPHLGRSNTCGNSMDL